MQRLLAAMEADPEVRVHLPTERLAPGDPGFIWGFDDIPDDADEHARKARQAIAFFTEPDLPDRIGDYVLESHGLRKIRRGDAWTDAEWPRRRADLWECYVEPVVTWLRAIDAASRPRSSDGAHPTHPAFMEQHSVLFRRCTEVDEAFSGWLSLLKNVWVPEGSTFEEASEQRERSDRNAAAAAAKALHRFFTPNRVYFAPELVRAVERYLQLMDAIWADFTALDDLPVRARAEEAKLRREYSDRARATLNTELRPALRVIEEHVRAAISR